MVLYATDIDDLVPSKKVTRKEKAAEPVTEPVVEEKIEKKKRVMSDKQKEALERGRIRRQEQKEAKIKAAEEEKAAKAKAEEDEKVLAEKLTNAGRKRKAKPEPKQAPQPEPTPEATPEPVLKKRKREPKLKAKENEPPEWFKSYVETVQKEKASTEGSVTKKQENIIKNEALRVAKKSWQSGLTRDLVQGEVNNHMDRMYSMIFGR
jgi:hypothetical protein